MEAIVLDGQLRSALAVIRSLGRKGIKVRVGSEIQPSLGSSSRYCFQEFSYQTPYDNSSGFIKSICNQLGKVSEPTILIPMSDMTLGEILENRGFFNEYIIIPFGESRSYNLASDKINLFRRAQELGIPVPKTFFASGINKIDELIGEAEQIGYPVVLKPGKSLLKRDKGWQKTKVRYANSRQELSLLLNSEPFNSMEFLIQERVYGPGMGAFLLLDKEFETLARFAHRRIREKPPSGGVSVICESIIPPENLFEFATKLLREFGLNGVAMVEFKYDRQKRIPVLMEINARFWGSLALAIAAGVDFPFLLYQSVSGEKIRPVFSYKSGVKMRWELGDLDHLLSRFRKTSEELALPPGAPTRARVFKDFCFDFFKPGVKHEIFRWKDPRPIFL